jgi:PAS domain S-box-containing protein
MMTSHRALTDDLEALDLVESAKQIDSRWLELLQNAYAQLENRRSLVDGLPDSVFRVNKSGDVLDSNKVAREMFGITEAGNVAELLPLDVAPSLIIAMSQALQTRTMQQLEFGLLGKHFAQQFEARVCPLGDEEVLIVVREITEQRWHQQARAFSESYFQALLQRLNTGVLICTAQGEVMIANDAMLRMLGQHDEDVLGLSYPELVPLIHSDADSHRMLLQQFEAALAGRAFPQVTLRVTDPALAGHSWLLVNTDLEHDEESQTTQLKITFTDVTDFRNAEIALRESEEQFSALMDRITDVIYHLDSQQEILFLNAAWPRLTGYSVEESLGRSMMEFVHPSDRLLCARAFQSAMFDEVTDIEVRLSKPHDGLCWVSLRNQQVTAPNGLVIGSYGMMIDITDRKRSEAARAELTAKARTVELLTTLLTNVSHDLRTPLSIIKLANFKAKHYWEKLDEGQRVKALAQIDEQVSRIMSFLEEYSDLARLDIDLSDFEPAPVLLNKLIPMIVQKMETHSPHQPREWVIEIDPQEIFIQGHADWLSKMVRHLLDNAAQFSSPGGRIVVRLYRSESLVSFEVVDYGMGIEPADREHIFEPLYRADKARTTGSGLAGLGLTLVRRIVEVHHGSIDIESDVGVGTTVRIQFPG